MLLLPIVLTYSCSFPCSNSCSYLLTFLFSLSLIHGLFHMYECVRDIENIEIVHNFFCIVKINVEMTRNFIFILICAFTVRFI